MITSLQIGLQIMRSYDVMNASMIGRVSTDLILKPALSRRKSEAMFTTTHRLRYWRCLAVAGLCFECERSHVRLRDSPEERIKQRQNGILVRRVQSEWVRASVPGASVGTLLARRLRIHVHAGHRHSGGLGQLELPR